MLETLSKQKFTQLDTTGMIYPNGTIKTPDGFLICVFDCTEKVKKGDPDVSIRVIKNAI